MESCGFENRPRSGGDMRLMLNLKFVLPFRVLLVRRETSASTMSSTCPVMTSGACCRIPPLGMPLLSARQEGQSSAFHAVRSVIFLYVVRSRLFAKVTSADKRRCRTTCRCELRYTTYTTHTYVHVK